MYKSYPIRSVHRCLLAILFTTIGFLNGCGRYAFTLNDNLIYEPPKLFDNFSLVDQALSECVKQHIIDNAITEPTQLTTLTCRHAGITSLAGLEVFSELTLLDLSYNALISIETLNKLEKLSLLKLNDNPKLDCRKTKELMSDKKDLMTELPKHCRV